MDDNVLPVVEELQRRLPLPAISLGEGEDDDQSVVNGTRNEMQTIEPTGMHLLLLISVLSCWLLCVLSMQATRLLIIRSYYL